MPVETIKCVDYPDKTPEAQGKKVDIEFTYELGTDLAENIKLFGEGTVNDIFLPALRLKLQKTSKIFSRKGDDVQISMTAYKPSDTMPRGERAPAVKVTDFMEIWPTLTDERKAELIAEMNATMAEQGGGTTKGKK